MTTLTRKYDLEQALLRLRIDAENAGLSYEDIAAAFRDEARQACDDMRWHRLSPDERYAKVVRMGKPVLGPRSPFASTV